MSSTVTGFENVNASGSSAAVTLIGSSGTNILTGGSGNDTITAGAGADTIVGGAGDDTINLANGDFAAGKSIDGGTQSTADSIVLTNASTVPTSALAPSRGSKTLTGGTGADTVTMAAAQWAGFTAINLGATGTNVLNVVASGDISALGTPAVSNVTTGNLTGTSGNNSVTLTGAQLERDHYRQRHDQSRHRHQRHNQSDIDFRRPEHVGCDGRFNSRSGSDFGRHRGSRGYHHPQRTERELHDHRQRAGRHHYGWLRHRCDAPKALTIVASRSVRCCWMKSTNDSSNDDLSAAVLSKRRFQRRRRCGPCCRPWRRAFQVSPRLEYYPTESLHYGTPLSQALRSIAVDLRRGR